MIECYSKKELEAMLVSVNLLKNRLENAISHIEAIRDFGNIIYELGGLVDFDLDNIKK